MHFPSPTILLLDDDAQFRAGITPALEAHGLRVMSSSKGRAARELIENKPPDLVIVDGLLPDTNGIEWIEQLREDGFNTPVIFVSAFYRDLGTFRHLTRDLDVISVFHKPLAIGRFARDVVDIITRTVEEPLIPPEEPLLPPAPVTSFDDVLFFEDDDDFPADFEDLRAEYARELPVSAGRLADAVSRLRDEGQRPSLVSEALRQAHDMHGTAGSYGYRKASRAAASLESELRGLQDSGRVNWETVDAAITTLEHHAALDSDAPVHRPSRPRPISGVAAAPPPTSAATWLLDHGADWKVGPRVLVLEDDPAMVAYLRSAVEDTLIYLDAAPNCEEALRLAQTLRPSVAIIGWPLARSKDVPGFLRDLRAQPGLDDLPAIMISVDDDPATLKKAAALGIDLFLGHPIDASELQRAVYSLAPKSTLESLRIAVFQDEEASGRLLEAGVESVCHNDLHDLLRELRTFRPQVVLLGPQVKDPTVSRMIRMVVWEVDAPILVFGGAKHQLELEADGALSKRGAWEACARQWAQWVARARAKAARCPETGLLLRDAATDALESGLAAAQRRSRSYAVAMIKPVHLQGLSGPERSCLRRHVARLVSGRFRAEDVRGTWSDETLVVGFQGPESDTLVDVLRRLQGEARLQPALLGLSQLDASFLVGVATYPLDTDTVRTLCAMASARLEDASTRDWDALVWRGADRG